MPASPRRILIACERSGKVRDAFASRGWDAWSCDLEETERPGQHYKGSVLDILGDNWNMLIGHPPCTYLANSGNQWIRTQCPERWPAMVDGASFFNLLWHAPIKHICIENPIMHKWAKTFVTEDYSQIIQPYYFGHPESKATCLWLKNLPPLKPTKIVEKEETVHGMSKWMAHAWNLSDEERRRVRSETFDGIAVAMAEQWTSFYVQQNMFT